MTGNGARYFRVGRKPVITREIEQPPRSSRNPRTLARHLKNSLDAECRFEHPGLIEWLEANGVHYRYVEQVESGSYSVGSRSWPQMFLAYYWLEIYGETHAVLFKLTEGLIAEP